MRGDPVRELELDLGRRVACALAGLASGETADVGYERGDGREGDVHLIGGANDAGQPRAPASAQQRLTATAALMREAKGAAGARDTRRANRSVADASRQTD